MKKVFVILFTLFMVAACSNAEKTVKQDGARAKRKADMELRRDSMKIKRAERGLDTVKLEICEYCKQPIRKVKDDLRRKPKGPKKDQADKPKGPQDRPEGRHPQKPVQKEVKE